MKLIGIIARGLIQNYCWELCDFGKRCRKDIIVVQPCLNVLHVVRGKTYILLTLALISAVITSCS
jgi:hypothetical protein